MAFEINTSSFGQHTVIILKDSTTNTFAEIFNFGAILNNFTSEHHGSPINVIDGFSSAAEAAEKITVFFKSAKLSPFACRVKNSKYSFGGKDHLLSKHALRGNAIHGLIYNVFFDVVEKYSDEEKAFAKLECVYDNA